MREPDVTLIVTKSVDEARQAVLAARMAGKTVGLVPTMGALHGGHASLMRAARARTGFVVVSIFVNPVQFAPNEDFKRYPRSIASDLDLCAAESVDCVFTPDVLEVYPAGFRTFVEVTHLQEGLCGTARPGHFRGVATVVLKLFNIIQPDVAYFGQKDAQQVRVLQQMVQDLNVPVELAICPIVREADGLALSSRNRYLTPDQRRQAIVLHQALEQAKAQIISGERSAEALIEAMKCCIASAPEARIDYVAIVDAWQLTPLELLRGDTLIALAVFIGNTRLIDNFLVRL
jgi:pantoate--beta-alanine ligase